MKRSHSSSSFGLSQENPLTSPTMTSSFLARNPAASIEVNQVSAYDPHAPTGQCAFENTMSLEGRRAQDVSSTEESVGAPQWQYNTQNGAYQECWNYQEACDNYRSLREGERAHYDGNEQPHVSHYQDFFGGMNQIQDFSPLEEATGYGFNAHPHFQNYMVPSYESSYGTNVSPGSYLVEPHYAAAAEHHHLMAPRFALLPHPDIAPIEAHPHTQSRSRSPFDLEKIEYGLGIRRSIVLNHHHDHSHNHDDHDHDHDHDESKKSVAEDDEFYEDADADAYDEKVDKVKKRLKKAIKPSATRKSTKVSGGGRPKHVGKACIHCKKAHLACDNARPCKRCVHMGKDDCIDVEHKRRGRPRSSPEKPYRGGPASAVALFTLAASDITHDLPFGSIAAAAE